MNTTAGIHARSLDAIDGWQRLDSALGRLEKHAEALSTPDTPTADDVVEKAYAAVLAGDEIPADFGEQLHQAEQAAAARTAAARALGRRAGRDASGLVGRLTNDRDQALIAGVDHALAVCRGELDEILAGAGTLAGHIGTATTPGEAIAAGDAAATAWRELGVLVTRYGLVRDAQEHLLGAAGYADGRVLTQTLEDCGYVANLEDVDPEWLDRRDRQAANRRPVAPGERLTHTPANTTRRAPWPSPLPTRGAGCWPTTNRVAYLTWLATDAAAQPWLPARDELAGRRQEMLDGLRQPARPASPKAEARMQRKLDRRIRSARIDHENNVEAGLA